MSLVPFDDRDGWIWLNGNFVPWREAKVHVLTHSLHYASSVYEGIRAYDGHAFKLREHIERLQKSGEILGYKLPYSTAELEKACNESIHKNNLKDCYLRPIAWRGTEQMGLSSRLSRIHVAIAVWEWPRYFELKKGSGLKLITSPWRRPPAQSAPVQSKAACHYTISTMAKHAAEEAGYHDSLMLSIEGNIAEATGANIFLVIDGKLHTPTPDCFLNGITRQTVIQLAKKRGLSVSERSIRPEEFARTQEVFITGTAAEITPVEAIDDYRFTPGAVTEMLQKDFRELVNAR